MDLLITSLPNKFTIPESQATVISVTRYMVFIIGGGYSYKFKCLCTCQCWCQEYCVYMHPRVHVQLCMCMCVMYACSLQLCVHLYTYVCWPGAGGVGVTDREITNDSSIEIYFCNARNLFLSLDDLPTTNITFLQPPSVEPPVPPGPDNVVSAANLSCTVTNEGSYQWQWTPPPGITLSQMWVADGNRTSIVQISQISAANAGNYTCQANFIGQSASTSTAVQLNRK